MRIGVARKLGAFDAGVMARFDAAVADLQRLGAEVVEIPLVLDDAAIGEAELEVLLHEVRPDFEHTSRRSPRRSGSGHSRT